MRQMSGHVLLGVITAAHGLRGEVKVKSFTEPPTALADYEGLCCKDGKPLRVAACRPANQHLIIRWHDISDRNQAEALVGTEIFVPRSELPPADADDFYHADLIGCQAVMADGTVLGQVQHIYDFGAGDILEIGSHMVPFTHENVPEIDLAARQITVCLPQDAPDLDDDQEAVSAAEGVAEGVEDAR